MRKRKADDRWWKENWGIVTGCTSAGAGCLKCWTRSMIKRFPALHGRYETGELIPFSQVVCHPERLNAPLKRRKPTVYAVSLLGDLFHEDVPSEFIRQAQDVMNDAPRHTYCLLTKRVQRAAHFLECGKWPGVILLASVWDQPSADAACAPLSQLRGVKWGLHAEPLLDSIDLRWAFRGQLPGKMGPEPAAPSWVVAGGENGPGARPSRADWYRSLRDQCKAAAIPFWLKSFGSNLEEDPWAWKPRVLDGREHNEVPW